MDKHMKNINNFEVMIGDIALTISSRNKVKFIEVAYQENPSIRGLFTIPNIEYYSGNIPEKDLSYMVNRVKNNVKYLKEFWEP